MDVSLELYATIGHLMTGIGTAILSILLYKTIRHMETSTQVAQIQAEYKFRPWLGPTGIIREIESNEKGKKIEIIIRNFGDLPATDVAVYSIVKSSQVTKDEIRSASNSVSLGPVLPNMEKRFWLDISNEKIQEAANRNGKISSGIIFEYPLSFGKSEYGLISEIDPKTMGFVHKEMWVHSPELKHK